METTDNAKTIFDMLTANGFGGIAAAGLMGNLYCESAMNPNNLQGIYNASLGMTDEEYTAKVDSGEYTKDKFCNDKAGYGLAQWTWHTRKQALYEYVVEKCKKSIGDMDSQLRFLVNELKSSYPYVYNDLVKAESVKEASDIILSRYEAPANQSDAVKEKRASIGTHYYYLYSLGTVPFSESMLNPGAIIKIGSKGDSVKSIQTMLIKCGFDCGECGADGRFGICTHISTRKFQCALGLEDDGIIGPITMAKLDYEYFRRL